MGVPVTGTIVPTDTSTDTYAVIDPVYGIDGLRSVADATARNAIPTLRRRKGMVVVLQSDLSAWQLNTSTNTGTNADWSAFGGGSGSSTRTFTWSLGFGSDCVVANDQANWVICTSGGTFSSWWTAAKTGPVGADLIFDVLISTDGGATFNTLWTAAPSDRARIVDGSGGNTGTTFEVTTFAAGDLLRLDVVQVGSTTAGQGVTLAILGTLS